MAFTPAKSALLCGFLVCWLVQAGAQAAAPDAGVARKPPSVPPMPSARSGIDYFRQLLAVSPEEREKLLASRPPDQRRVLENNVRLYLAMSAQERELRLRTMDLRFYLTSLMRMQPTNRAEFLKTVPDGDRLLVQERLKIWDQLSPAAQKKALEDERMIRVMTAVKTGNPRVVPLTGQTSNQVRQIEEQLIRWHSLPESRRAQVEENYTRLFEWTDVEKIPEVSGGALGPEERALMQKALDHFKSLSATQRAMCVQAFTKLAELSPAERRQFLASAEEWQKMKPEDRENWRQLVGKVPPLPPMPPGFRQPPFPPSLRPPARSLQVTTN